MLLEQLQARVRRGEALEYVLFWGHQQPDALITASCLSQWYPSPFEVNGLRYATAEHWMMAEKARLFDDAAILARILENDRPDHAKKLGGQVRGFDEVRWKSHRFEIVTQGNVHKFTQHAALRKFLLGTADKVLVEASPLDRIWGIGLAREDARALDPLSWRGLNLLGFALMVVRGRLAA